MKFKETHPDYKDYQSDTYYYDHLPNNFFDAFHGLIEGKAISDEYPVGILKAACDIISLQDQLLTRDISIFKRI
ncbi:hypothetical protein [Bacillus albus]|uniref:Uncharacterized protein n=1 Tax=Bacillus albus TaxID=2026189 RepID=A0A1J9UBB0_9BACI|nr:hypothetical protein [Bacillus albus]OJD61309.1 hypothetical protein BAU25_15745 [Bacillus albus]